MAVYILLRIIRSTFTKIIPKLIRALSRTIITTNTFLTTGLIIRYMKAQTSARQGLLYLGKTAHHPCLLKSIQPCAMTLTTAETEPLIFDKYSFQRERNIIRITTDLYQTFKDETSYNDTNISLKAEFDLGKGTLYIDHIETWKGTNKYGNVRALYHPQGTIKRASSSY